MNRRTASLPFPLRATRALLRRLNSYLSRHYEGTAARGNPMPVPPEPDELKEAEEQLLGLDLEDGAVHEYFRKHLPRLARTLTLAPKARSSGRILELGCYMQMTPFLAWRGYTDVRGGYYGPIGRVDKRTASVRGERFEASVALFDAERDIYPYQDGSFETVLACELIEHLARDPMHFVLECRRILEDGGRLIVTTPNAASLTSVARVLHGYNNPQISSVYHRPRADAPDEAPHVREYTAFELGRTLEAGGFEIESLFTEPIGEFEMNRPMWNFLEENGYNNTLRGEQTYCVAVKRGDGVVERYPQFLYSP